MRISFRSIFILVPMMLLIAACGGARDLIVPPATQTMTSSLSSSQTPNEFDIRIMTTTASLQEAINSRRAEAGSPALISPPALSELAFKRATDLAVRASMSHEDPDTGSVEVETALAEMGYAGPAAELLYAAPDPLDTLPQRVIDTWFADPMHKALLLESSFRYCGIGMMGDGNLWKISLVLTVNPLEEALP
jgi:uncharacterized protein YkwD